MGPEIREQVLRHLVAALVVLGVALALRFTGMHAAAATGVAVIAVAAMQGSAHWRAGRCARKGP